MTDTSLINSKNSSLYDCLTEVKLDRFYENFVRSNITSCEKLASISIVDFVRYGVTTMNDRLRLFQLIQIIKSVILKKHDLGLINNSESFYQQIKKVRSDDHFPSHTFVSHSKSPHKVKLGGTNKLKARKILFEEIQTRPHSMTNGGTFDFSIESQHRPTIFKRIKESEPKYKSDDENLSWNAKTPTEELEEDTEVYSNNIFNIDLTAEKDLQKDCFTNYSKSNKEEHDMEKLFVLKETFHNCGYNYGIPEKYNSKNVTPNCKNTIGKPNADKVKVCVRKRPRNLKEVSTNDPDVVTIRGTNTVIVQEQKTTLNLSKYIHQHVMTFDEAFDDTKSNEDVYNSTVKPLVSFVLKRGTAICFTFGQTGAGKTHTLIGSKTSPGLYQLAGKDLFDSIQISCDANIWVSFYEIYCGQLFDLLNNRKKLILMEKHSRQVCVTGLMETCATDLRSLVHIVNFGRLHRSKGCSGVNPVSSRSHAVLQMDVRSIETNKRIGRLTFIDLAGSERASDAMKCNKQTRYEGAEINQSLLALKECIRSLDQEQSYTPYRQSKLTHILRESFSGNCQSVMIANISPTLTACENTINTLRYADRVQELKRGIQNKVKEVRRRSKDSENPSNHQICDTSSFSPNKVIPDRVESSTTFHVDSPTFLSYNSGHSFGILPLNIKFPPSDTMSLNLPRDKSLKSSGNNVQSVNKMNFPRRDSIHSKGHSTRDHYNPSLWCSKNKINNDINHPTAKPLYVRSLKSVDRNCLSQNGRSHKNDRSVSNKKVLSSLLNAGSRDYVNKHCEPHSKYENDSQTVFLLRSSQIAQEIEWKGSLGPKMSSNKTDSSKNLESYSAEDKNKSPVDKSEEKLFPLENNFDKDSYHSKPIDDSNSSKTLLSVPVGNRHNDTEDTPNDQEKKDSEDSLDALNNSIIETASKALSPINYVLDSEALLINAHEKHLDSVTQLCREEIDLLMKLRTGKMPFHNYVNKIRTIMTTRKQMSDALINHIGQFASFNNSLS